MLAIEESASSFCARDIPGTGLHHDLETELDEFFNDFGYGGNAFFTRCDLFWHSYDLRHESPLFIRLDENRSRAGRSGGSEFVNEYTIDAAGYQDLRTVLTSDTLGVDVNQTPV